MIGAMRAALLPLFALLLAAATPSDEARRLMDAGEELRAYQLIEAASNRGDIDAVGYLAWFFESGRVVARDLPHAAALYRRAAEAGQRHAQWRLGVMLDEGDGIPENPAEAFVWIRRAAEQGSPAAFASLGVMYANGRGVAVDFAQSMHWYRRAAGQGYAHGFYGVGVLYTLGQGVRRDEREGLAWMLCAATLGDESAARHIEDYRVGPGQSGAVIARANAIFRELGQGNRRVHVEDAEAPPVPVT